MTSERITNLFLDVGGVLATNGWDRRSRDEAAITFGLDRAEFEERHGLTFGAHEEGRMTLDEYLNQAVFHEPRPFTLDEFRAFVFSRSRPFPEMLGLVRNLKARYGLKLTIVSNEGRELTLHRIQNFGLAEIAEVHIFSCFVGVRKPDQRIYRIALDVTQVLPEHVAYLDDRRLFAEVACGLGIHGIHHAAYESTRQALAELGLPEQVERRL